MQADGISSFLELFGLSGGGQGEQTGVMSGLPSGLSLKEVEGRSSHSLGHKGAPAGRVRLGWKSGIYFGQTRCKNFFSTVLGTELRVVAPNCISRPLSNL